MDFLKILLRRDPLKRPAASEALQHPWVKEEGTASDLPLSGTVVQRLQRFSTYGHLKQVVLRMIAEELASDMNARHAVKDLKVCGPGLLCLTGGNVNGMCLHACGLHKVKVQKLDWMA